MQKNKVIIVIFWVSLTIIGATQPIPALANSGGARLMTAPVIGDSNSAPVRLKRQSPVKNRNLIVSPEPVEDNKDRNKHKNNMNIN